MRFLSLIQGFHLFDDKSDWEQEENEIVFQTELSLKLHCAVSLGKDPVKEPQLTSCDVHFL